MKQLGYNTETLFFKLPENSVLRHEFTTSAIVYPGQQVKLGADGTVSPLVTADDQALSIGFSMGYAAADGEVTVQLKGQCIIYAKADGALDAGPVKVSGFNTDSQSINFNTGTNETGAKFYGHPTYEAITPANSGTETQGFNITQVAAAGKIMVILNS